MDEAKYNDDQYTSPSNEIIDLYKDGPYFYVISTNGEEVRWCKMYRNYDDAKIEFER